MQERHLLLCSWKLTNDNADLFDEASTQNPRHWPHRYNKSRRRAITATNRCPVRMRPREQDRRPRIGCRDFNNYLMPISQNRALHENQSSLVFIHLITTP